MAARIYRSWGAMILLLLSVPVHARQNTRVVEFGVGTRIREMKATENYVAVKISQDTKPYNTAFLFDKNGNALLKTTGENRGWILQSEVVEQLGYFVVVDPGYEGAEGVKGSDDLLRIFDIKTQAEVRRINSNAYRYRISPNALHASLETNLFWWKRMVPGWNGHVVFTDILL